ncbi:hypothetical protein C7B80_25110 [Cyanosarcina cf. burmensis CCALA 770]|nr:hypothetical protein C7B80_25110 [Cyanosarcina cf. burmensis CCALA 770]
MSRKIQLKLWQQTLAATLGLGVIAATVQPGIAGLGNIERISSKILSPLGIDVSSYTTGLGSLEGISSRILSTSGVDISPYLKHLRKAKEFYTAITQRDLEGILDGVDYTIGELGYPILGDDQPEIEEIALRIYKNPEPYSPYSVDFKNSLQSQFDYSFAKTQLKFQLGEEGQKVIQDARLSVLRAATSAFKSAQASQRLTVSQSILKQLSLQSAQQTAIDQASYNEIQQNRINTGLTSYAVTKLARNSDMDSWRRRIEDAGALKSSARIQASAMGYAASSSKKFNSLFP